MQNIDFYDRKNLRPTRGEMSFPQEAEYFSMHASGPHSREVEPRGSNASRLMFVIIALCIISFTTGMVMGLKFAGGSKKEIVDRQTASVMTGIGKKMTGIIKTPAAVEERQAPAPRAAEQKFPRENYPVAIRLDRAREAVEAEKIAAALSEKGHRVILSRQGEKLRLYVGPYKTQGEADEMLKKLDAEADQSLRGSFRVIKR